VSLSRRTLVQAIAAAMAWPFPAISNAVERQFRVRTVMAGIPMATVDDFAKVKSALEFLGQARQAFVREKFEVQTVRIATQPLPEYLPDWRAPGAIEALRVLDERAVAGNVAFSIGPVLTDGAYDLDFARFAAELVLKTQNISLTVAVSSRERGVHTESVRAAAEAMSAIARRTPGGEGNFRFAATAFCPPGIPFFPAAFHTGEPGFSIGLETPPLLQKVFERAPDLASAKADLKSALNNALREIENIANGIERETGWHYLGIDTSPAPLTGASIGQAIETLTKAPFGEPGTLAACATITDVLKAIDVKTCGYCGLMLPVLEDPVLARRAAEGRYTVSELLLYSSVCGTGLDVVPLPGDTSVEALTAVIADVGALAAKYTKPLSARLFPVPGKKAGDMVSFDNPYLTNSVVMPLS
jgi:uncharacterized protein (UPF0210 family)